MQDDSDITDLIAPKSDQLNGDDFVTGPVDVTILASKVNKGAPQQPVWLTVSGYDRPWKPCKTTLRLMAEAWGTTQTQKWVGKSVRLFRDPSVKYGGEEKGGIRVSHMSHIARGFSTPVAINKTVRKVWKIEVLDAPPLAVEAAKPAAPMNMPQYLAAARAAAVRGSDVFRQWCKENPIWRQFDAATMEKLHAVRKAADAADADPFGLLPIDPVPTDEQRAAEMAQVAAELAGRADE